MLTTLPISGAAVALREPCGSDDLLLLNGERSVPDLTRTLLAALSGDAAAVDALAVGDAEALLLAVRRSLLGEHVRGELQCARCGTAIEIAFRIEDYLRHHRPRAAAPEAGDDGWLSDAGVAFRIPTLRDQAEVSGHPQAALTLLRRCLRGQADRRTRLRAERALERIAPTLSGHVTGLCPECGERVEAYFDVEQFVLRELRSVARELFDDVHRIATAYGWSEAEILALPRSRRALYADRLRDGAGA